MARETQGEVDNAGGGERETKRRMGEVMRGKLGPRRVTDVPQIFGIEVLFELGERDGREEKSSIRERERMRVAKVVRSIVRRRNDCRDNNERGNYCTYFVDLTHFTYDTLHAQRLMPRANFVITVLRGDWNRSRMSRNGENNVSRSIFHSYFSTPELEQALYIVSWRQMSYL